jgi:threonine aldolase
VIDLRSDTVTRPTPAMRKAMAQAEVGDDVFGDDPTVNRLQEAVAERVGKEAALYTVTGTMANQAALRTFVRTGHEVVTEATSHIVTVEKNAAAALSGITYRPIQTERGILSPEQVVEALKPDPLDVRVADLVEVENTHQVGGGSVYPLQTLRAIREVTRQAGLPLYMDGARIWNASVASGVPVREYAEQVDALMFCFSKGLGAPIGSILCGPADFIAEARRVRVQLCGAWRQAGVLAAAALVTLYEDLAEILRRTHEQAYRLASGIAELAEGAVDVEAVDTNIVFVDPAYFGGTAAQVVERLRAEDVLATIVAGKVRMLTHRDLSDEDIDKALAAWRRLTG